MSGFDDILQQYGGDPASLLKFDVDGPELLPYATLTAARLSGDVDLAALGACMNGRIGHCCSWSTGHCLRTTLND